MSLSCNNVLPTTLEENYMIFKTGDGISIQLILIFKLVKGNMKTKFPHNRAPLPYLQTQTNNLERQYESNDSLDSAVM